MYSTRWENNDEAELILIGPPAEPGTGIFVEDWFTVLRALGGPEAPGVPSILARILISWVRYFGGIENTNLGALIEYSLPQNGVRPRAYFPSSPLEASGRGLARVIEGKFEFSAAQTQKEPPITEMKSGHESHSI